MNYKSVLFLLLSLFLFIGCKQSTEKVELENPRTRLVIDLFNAFQKKDHRGAVNKVLRLKQLDKKNYFLETLEKTEKINMVTLQIQDEIDENNIEKAMKISEDAIRQYGRQKRLLEIYDILRKLKEINRCVVEITSPKDALDLAKNSLKLENVIKKYKPASPLLGVVKQKLENAKKLRLMETERAIYYMKSNQKELDNESNVLAPIASAVLDSITLANSKK